MSHISDMLGGWQGDPDELRNQEALFSMYSRQTQPNNPNNYLYRSHEPQALVPIQGFESQGLQSIRSMAGSSNYGRVPIWQPHSGFGLSPFQRLGYSTMFSSYTRSSHNIFTPTGSQRRRPVFLIIGGTNMYSGIPTESVYSQMPTNNTSSGPVITELPDTPDEEDAKCLEFPPFQGKSRTSTDNTSGGPVMTELLTTPEEEGQKCLEFKPLPGKSRLSLNKHKNKLPVPSKSETELKEHDSFSAVKFNLSETVSQQISNNTSMEIIDSNANKSKLEDFSVDTNLESNSYSSLPSISGHDNTENTAYTETEANQNIELAELIGADTRESNNETMNTDKSVFNNEDEMVQLISDLKQSANRNQSVNKEYVSSNNKNRPLKSNTAQGKYNNFITDKEKCCEGHSNKERNENKTQHVQSRSSRLSVQFNLDHLDKTERVNSEAILIDKSKADKEHKHFVTSSRITVKEPTPSFCSSKENKTDLSVSILSLLPEKNEDSLSIDNYKNCFTEPSGFETSTKTSNARDNYSADDHSERLVERTNGNNALEQDLVPKSCSKAKLPFEGKLRANPTVTPSDADSTANFENLADLGFIAGSTALKAGSESVNEMDGVDGADTRSTEEFDDNFNGHSDEPVAEPRTPTHGTDSWHQDQYGAEEEKGLHYLEMVSNLRGLVAKEGLVVKDVYPDGNCLFAAVVDQLRVRGEFYFTSRTLRKAAVEHLKQYPFQPDGTPLFCFVTDASWEAYLIRMAKEGEWGDHLIISAISSVLKRKLVILGGLSGLSRTVQEPDHAYKEITRGMKHPDTRIPKDPDNGGSDRQNDSNNGAEGKTEQWQTVNPEVENGEKEAESLYLGHLAESHYVSLRRQDWEQELHTILINKKDSDLLTYRSDKKFSGKELGPAAVSEHFGLPEHHLSFLMCYVVRNAEFTMPLTPLPCEDVHNQLHHVKKVGPTALGLNPSLVQIPSYAEPNRLVGADLNKFKLNLSILDIPNDTNVIEASKAGNDVDLILNNDNCFPGYTRLVPVDPAKWGKFVSMEDGVSYLRHIRCKDEIISVGPVTSQKFLAFKGEWPEVAKEWKNKQRPNNWPRKEEIDIVVRNGCHFVSPDKTIQDTLWKYSFDSAEKTLVTFAVSESMKSCFIMFKTLLDYIFRDREFNIHLLLSILFHCCEESQVQDWKNQPAKCLLRLIKLLKLFLRHDFFPNYFVSTWNVLDGVVMYESVEWYLSKLEVLESDLFVSIYFMLDEHNQTLKMGHTVDRLVEDVDKIVKHQCAEQSFEDCFSPITTREVQMHIRQNDYKTASTVIRQTYQLLQGVQTENQECCTYMHFLLNVLCDIPLIKRWGFAVYWDYMNGSNLVQQLFGAMETVPLSTILGMELTHELTEGSGETDILVPKRLTRPLALLNFMRYFSTYLLYELGLEDMYGCSIHFFLKSYCDSLLDSANAFFAVNQTTKGYRILRVLSMMYKSNYVEYLYDGNEYEFIDLLDGCSKVCDLLNSPKDLEWMAELWNFFGKPQEAEYYEQRARMFRTGV